mmetsp:Transcript_26578/g.87122  ORF Transcript_26578/g.87122 Transcript_26578/m.87122 type:complete len:440 (-) Transcript_26578:1221-2540(-)
MLLIRLRKLKQHLHAQRSIVEDADVLGWPLPSPARSPFGNRPLKLERHERALNGDDEVLSGANPRQARLSLGMEQRLGQKLEPLLDANLVPVARPRTRALSQKLEEQCAAGKVPVAHEELRVELESPRLVRLDGSHLLNLAQASSFREMVLEQRRPRQREQLLVEPELDEALVQLSDKGSVQRLSARCVGENARELFEHGSLAFIPLILLQPQHHLSELVRSSKGSHRVDDSAAGETSDDCKDGRVARLASIRHLEERVLRFGTREREAHERVPNLELREFGARHEEVRLERHALELVERLASELAHRLPLLLRPGSRSTHDRLLHELACLKEEALGDPEEARTSSLEPARELVCGGPGPCSRSSHLRRFRLESHPRRYELRGQRFAFDPRRELVDCPRQKGAADLWRGQLVGDFVRVPTAAQLLQQREHLHEALHDEV